MMVVETQGSAGSTPLSAAEIAAADAVIFAHDLPVKDAGRFAGKPTVDVGVKKGISDGPALVAQAVALAEQWKADPSLAAAAAAAGAAASRWRARQQGRLGGRPRHPVRQWLMTGVSYMIPFVAAGGILIALGFMLAQLALGEQGAIEIVKYGLTAEGEFNITQNFNPSAGTSWAALLFVIGAAAFGFLVPILSGFIAFAIADRPGLVPGIVGGSIAATMGAGFLGGLVTGILGGLVARWISGWKVAQGRPRDHAGRRHPAALDAHHGRPVHHVLGRPIKALTEALTDAPQRPGRHQRHPPRLDPRRDDGLRPRWSGQQGGLRLRHHGPRRCGCRGRRSAATRSWRPSWPPAWSPRSPWPWPPPCAGQAVHRARA
jgi:PTS system fructose-specific IIC component